VEHPPKCFRRVGGAGNKSTYILVVKKWLEPWVKGTIASGKPSILLSARDGEKTPERGGGGGWDKMWGNTQKKKGRTSTSNCFRKAETRKTSDLCERRGIKKRNAQSNASSSKKHSTTVPFGILLKMHVLPQEGKIRKKP